MGSDVRTTDVCFGSKADVWAAKSDVRFTPNSDRESGHVPMVMSALPPKGDIGTLWPVHHFGWRFQQGKVVALTGHIWVSRRENAERVVWQLAR
jgi:hypothetical protein